MRFGNTELTERNYGDETTLSVTVPAQLLASGGTYPVTVFNPATNANTSNPINFTVTAQIPR